MKSHEADRALAHLKALVSEHEVGDEHKWRTCRACLAQESTLHEDVRADLRVLIAEVEGLQVTLREFLGDLDCGSFTERHALDHDSVLKVKIELGRLL
jgi:hypothetical protein